MEIPDSPPPRESSKDSTVFVGSKHIMNYVNSIEMQIQNNPEVILKARGKFISKAIDITEIAKRPENLNIKVKDIKISTEEYEKEGKKVRVSTVEISLAK